MAEAEPVLAEPVFFDADSHQWCCLHCWTPDVRQYLVARRPVPCCASPHPVVPGVMCSSDPGHPGFHRACGPGRSHHPVIAWS